MKGTKKKRGIEGKSKSQVEGKEESTDYREKRESDGRMIRSCPSEGFGMKLVSVNRAVVEDDGGELGYG